MKFLATILAALLVFGTLAPTTTFAQPAPPSNAALKNAVARALAGVDKTNSKAVNAAILALAAQYPGSVAAINGFAVGILGQALAGSPSVATKVIVGLNVALSKAYPAAAPAITAAGLKALPASLKDAVGPNMISQTGDLMASRKDKAKFLSDLYRLTKDDPSLTPMLDLYAQAEKIKILTSTDADVADNGDRFIVDDILADAFFSGDQGVSTLGSSGFGGASGGSGNPSNTGGSNTNNDSNDNPSS